MYKIVIKRIFDFLFSLIIIPFILLILLILFPIVKLNSKGPFIYKSERVGKNEKPFIMYKIRTMKINSPDIKNEDGTTFSSENDPRVTAVGRFLRKFSLDELPQIFNVLFGQMSIIGPRPDMFNELIVYDKNGYDRTRFLLKPGITGYAQVKGRNAISWDDKNKYDVYYVENISFILDVKIFFLTFVKVLKSEGINQKTD